MNVESESNNVIRGRIHQRDEGENVGCHTRIVSSFLLGKFCTLSTSVRDEY